MGTLTELQSVRENWYSILQTHLILRFRNTGEHYWCVISCWIFWCPAIYLPDEWFNYLQNLELHEQLALEIVRNAIVGQPAVLILSSKILI